ncbi:hypothetical protein BDQ17DRAFT_1434361 [Cyathus striatus]|nr:hypothetical protein BDQ17DRAFT_1434361 [Cyathus striatus]
MLGYITLNVGFGGSTSKRSVHGCLELTSPGLFGWNVAQPAPSAPSITYVEHPPLSLYNSPRAQCFISPARATLQSCIFPLSFSTLNAFPAYTVLDQPTLVERVKSHLDSINVFYHHADSPHPEDRNPRLVQEPSYYL